VPIIRRKLLYLCDTGICHSAWVASGLLVGLNPTSRPEINKYIKQNCAPSWIYLLDYTGMHGQQNIEKRCNLTCGTWPKPVTGTALNNLHLSTRSSRAVGSTPRPCYQRGKRTRYPLNKGLGGPRNWSGSTGKQKHLLPLPRIKPYSLVIQPVAWSLHRLIYSLSAGYAHRCISKLPQIMAWRLDRSARENVSYRRLNRTTRNNVGNTRTVNVYKLMAWLH